MEEERRGGGGKSGQWREKHANEMKSKKPMELKFGTGGWGGGGAEVGTHPKNPREPTTLTHKIKSCGIWWLLPDGQDHEDRGEASSCRISQREELLSVKVTRCETGTTLKRTPVTRVRASGVKNPVGGGLRYPHQCQVRAPVHS